MMSDAELQILSFYRASELAGSILLGRLALQTTNDRLRVPLTEQCLEEARHAWLFTKVITDLGATPVRMTQTYQSEVGKVYGMPENMLDILCLTRVLEVAVLDHYVRHARMPDLHPAIRQTLETVIEDESGHVDWIQTELDAYAQEHGRARVDDALRRAETASRAVLQELRRHPAVKAYFGDTAEGPA